MRVNCSGIRIVHRLAMLLVVPDIAVACSSTDPAAPIATDTTGATADESLEPQQPLALNMPRPTSHHQDSDMTSIRIMIAGQPVTAQIADNPTARDSWINFR